MLRFHTCLILEVAVLILLLGCGGKSDTSIGVFKEIIDLESWTLADPTTAPFPSHQPDEINCTNSAFEIESSQLEVSTDRCNYISIDFEALQTVPMGTSVKSLILHTGLWAPEPGEAHVAWVFNDTVFWELSPEIPASTEFYFHEAELPVTITQGDIVHFHLHNHGANDWKVAEFQRQDVE